MDAKVRDDLRDLIRRYGCSLTEDPARCEALLNDQCAAHKREINVLIGALRQGVAKDLLSARQAPPSLQIDRLTRRLEDDLGLAPEPARWAVETWALVLGVDDGLSPATRRESPATAPEVPDIHGWSADRVQALQRDAARSLGLAVVFRDPLQTPVKVKAGGLPGLLGKGEIISHGPEMVVVPAGSYLMGSPEGEEGRHYNEGPQHRVTIARPFALGRYAVTFDDYDARCAAMGWGKANVFCRERGRQPFANVLIEGAVAYCQWLSGQTGQTYRLPSEAEWEYACRAGTATAFHFGSTISTAQANYGRWHEVVGGGQLTVPVGSLPANPWGLHEMHGNIWEYCEDDWNADYRGAPTDGSAWVEKHHRPNVMRGGAFHNDSHDLRSASRARRPNDDDWPFLGFRVARTLSP
ncbi:formylglycine-generating enzyme family protein [Candidatus Thiodictyon syntrophicum]|jgi:formylglycine-generating enzyme required for sulfatase activity|uniref:Sulfatase-modifying factor enzyme-like domain-containing protein n=1 Tax=Candidatus Thiodictyon syntrophicum TaxID=1166950 RepID=A0A2K8U4L6_9GAMM|nr:formylglycine-generating enzyme family protein [Candidatus Thiodictyon syntrophicum]AUB80512.1 hypothetical protein THSYN_05815 [Candidatus Thiodictyon syntrophicum]